MASSARSNVARLLLWISVAPRTRMSDDDIRDLLSRRDIERVEADPETAADELQTARNHLASAARISDDEARHWPNSRRQTRKP